MSQTKVQFIECENDSQIVVVVRTTLRGGLVAHLVDTFSRIRVEVHKVESRLEDESWVQRLVVAAPGGKPLDRALIDELRAAVFATIEMVSQNDADVSSGTFSTAPQAAVAEID